MSALGYFEEIPLFGDLVGIEPINEPVNIRSYEEHELLSENGLTDMLWFPNSVKETKSQDYCQQEHGLESFLTKDACDNNTALHEFINEVSSSGLVSAIPEDPVGNFDESLANLVSLLESEDASQLTTIDFDALNSPISDQPSSYSSSSPTFDLESELAPSPSSLGDSEYSLASPCPSFSNGFQGFRDSTLPGEISPYNDGFQQEYDEIVLSGLYDQSHLSSKGQSRRSRGKEHRLKPYATVPKKGFRLDEMAPVERVERKKEQNKTAASRYRLKKKAEKMTIDEEHTHLQDKNRELKDKVSSISREIQYLKELMKEVLKAKKMKTPKGKSY